MRFKLIGIQHAAAAVLAALVVNWFAYAENDSKINSQPVKPMRADGRRLMERRNPPNSAGDEVEIPLDQIRIGSNGSRQLRDLEPEYFIYLDTPEKIGKYSAPEGIKEMEMLKQRASEKSLVYALETAMQAMLHDQNAKTSTGFAVQGRDRSALQGIYNVLVKHGKPNKEFRAGTDISAVFFSRPAQPYVQLSSVVRKKNVIIVTYRLVSHATQDLGWKLAIIPLGKLVPGEYRVQYVRETAHEGSHSAHLQVPLGTETSIICQPFSFFVAEQL